MTTNNGRAAGSVSNNGTNANGVRKRVARAAVSDRPRPHYARFAHIVGWGMAVPERVLSNHEIARLVETSDEWIVARTGIKERRIAEGKETTTSLAIESAQNALEMADISPEDVDLIIVATATPEYSFPSTASLVQDAIGAERAAAFDLSAACTGFIAALGTAAESVRCGSTNIALVIGAETLTKVTDWEDRGTCILFGDGAGAVVLQGSDVPGGIMSYLLRSDGSGGNLLTLPSVGATRPGGVTSLLDHTIDMNGREVFRFATRAMVSITREAVTMAGLSLENIDLIIPHQANRRIIEAAARGLEMPDEKFYMNVDRYGNTSAASIPMALCEAVEEGRVRPNDRLVLVGFGGGLTWGAIAVHWDVTPPPEVSRWRHLGRQVRYGLSRARSVGRRVLRRVEGAVFGAQALEAEPPHRGKK